MNKQTWITAVIMLVLGGGGGYWFASQDSGPSQVSPDTAQERKALFYRNPMNPAITSPVPAQDEMGMDYIPVYEGGDSKDQAGAVSIDPTVVQNIGVRTVEAKRKTISRDVRT
ncbi:MAG: efflux transporter periplasmic adaptor subunit, partial [Mariprofundus sp.]